MCRLIGRRSAATLRHRARHIWRAEALVRSGRLHHDGDPVLAWMVSNVVCHRDKKDNIYPNKGKRCSCHISAFA